LDGNAGPAEGRCAAQDFRINRDWQLIFHHLYDT
jgi:hypothetical protein